MTSPRSSHAACGATWTAKRAEHCPACHLTFSGTSIGDRHRAGPYARRRCVPAFLLPALGLVLDSRGIWAGAEFAPRPLPTPRARTQSAVGPAPVGEGT